MTSYSIDLPLISAAHGCLSWPNPCFLIIIAPLTETVTRCSAPSSLFEVPEDISQLATGTAKCFCSSSMFRLAFYPWQRSVRVTFSKSLWLENAEAGLQTPLTITSSAFWPVAAPRNTAKLIVTLLKPQKKAKHALLVESQNPLVLTDGPESPYVVLADVYLF